MSDFHAAQDPTRCAICGKTWDHHNTVTLCPGRKLVPRVAESLDDLRVGQKIVRHLVTGQWGQVFTVDIADVGPKTSRIFDEHAQQVVILSDPPPEPVTVSREAFDRLAAAADEWQSGTSKHTVGPAARALVDEVRGADA